MIKSIVLVSGGMDSLVTAAIANKESDEIYFLHIKYGQKTEKKEEECFENIVRFYNPKKYLISNIDYLSQIGGSSLTDNSIKINDYNKNDKNVPNTYVPFRNAHFICIATSWAEVIGANRIYIGAVEEDSSGYPDCTEIFYNYFNKTIDVGTKKETKIEIRTPIIHMSKAEIIQIGKELNSPFEFSWSCYRNNNTACGKCDSCNLRINAFRKNKAVDPIKYAFEIDWKQNEKY